MQSDINLSRPSTDYGRFVVNTVPYVFLGKAKPVSVGIVRTERKEYIFLIFSI